MKRFLIWWYGLRSDIEKSLTVTMLRAELAQALADIEDLKAINRNQADLLVDYREQIDATRKRAETAEVKLLELRRR